uniref:Epidermal growth factor receptor pathway substrate 8 n=1 Tax=Rousettus aegyptiacus TaxID=9407 RepID=A0A7J8JCX1_ROUAE|nr:epidermal growth factor receptor pathway substrate 8 [Rousettus aegyptiacus]
MLEVGWQPGLHGQLTKGTLRNKGSIMGMKKHLR